MTREELAAIRARDALVPASAVAGVFEDRRALLALADALAEAAGRVTCRRCDDSGYEPWSDFGGAVIEPCPDCAPLRELLEVVR